MMGFLISSRMEATKNLECPFELDFVMVIQGKGTKQKKVFFIRLKL